MSLRKGELKMALVKLCWIGTTSLVGSVVLVLSLWNHLTQPFITWEELINPRFVLGIGLLLWLGHIYATECLFLTCSDKEDVI